MQANLEFDFTATGNMWVCHQDPKVGVSVYKAACSISYSEVVFHDHEGIHEVVPYFERLDGGGILPGHKHHTFLLSRDLTKL